MICEGSNGPPRMLVGTDGRNDGVKREMAVCPVCDQPTDVVLRRGEDGYRVVAHWSGQATPVTESADQREDGA